LFKNVRSWLGSELIGASTNNSGRRIEYLDGLRGVAVTMVVLFHAAMMWSVQHPHAKDWLISRYGSMGVELFFLISGFVILMTLEKCKTFGEFMKRRWLRLWPAMLVACAAYFIILPFIPADPHASIFPGLTLIDDRWYSWAFGRPIHSLEGAYWSLYLEMRFYVIFGLCYFAFGERVAIGALIASSLVYLFLLSTGHGMGEARWWDIRLFAWFASGALFYRYFRSECRLMLGLGLAAGALAAWVYYPAPGPRMFGFFLVIVFAVGAKAPIVRRVLAGRVLAWLGAVSYPLYLVHGHLIEAFGPLFGIGCSLAAAYVIARYGEPRLRAVLDHALRLRPLVGRIDTEGQPPIRQVP
jgi:peptidoglycan/LPS O-acetylase OafA/YrhL